MAVLYKDNSTNYIYVNSENIKVFPTAYRAENVNIESRLQTEANITQHSPVALTRTYIKDWGNLTSSDITLNSGILKFFINGYYFEISELSQSLISQYTNLYAYIKTSNISVASGETTQKLVSWYSVTSDPLTESAVENDVLDAKVEGESGPLYFTGLILTDTELTTVPYNGVIKIKYNGHANYGAEPAAIETGDGDKKDNLKFNDLENNQAIGAYSIASGYNTIANGDYSIAEGKLTKTGGNDSGTSSETAGLLQVGDFAHAEGFASIAKGAGSHAEGFNTFASATGAHAEGDHTEATGNNAHSEGILTKATKLGSHAEGYQNEADAEYSHVEGQGTHTVNSCDAAHAEGYLTEAAGKYSHVEGKYTKTYKEGAHAEGVGAAMGDWTEANGIAAHAEGYTTKARADYAHSEGSNTQAKGQSSHAEGSTTVAEGTAAHAEGLFTWASGDYSHAEGRGAGDGVHAVTASGVCSHAEGSETEASGEAAHAEGGRTYATKNFAHAEGKETEANGEAAHAEGISTKATKEGTHAEGSTTTASENYAHAEGYNTAASGEAAHAEGSYTAANGAESHAEGNYTQASALGAHAEGAGSSSSKVTASAKGAHAEGVSTSASSTAAHAEGNFTSAEGTYSHAEGDHTVAKVSCQHVFGKYNADKSGTIEIAGYGDSNTRKNIRILDTSGNEWLRGGLYVGDTANTLGTSFSEKLYVNGTAKITSKLTNNDSIAVGNGTKDASMINGSGSGILDIYGSEGHMYLDANEILTSSSSGLYLGAYNDSNSICITNGGQVQANSFYAKSDKRLKENIILYKSEKSILDLPVYKYDFIEGDKNQIGCLAQDLQAICPELVNETNDGYLAINESKIVYLLIDEVKKLKAEVEGLKKK